MLAELPKKNKDGTVIALTTKMKTEPGADEGTESDRVQSSLR